ncbi:MarR family winged helix-turn-helix transcriptional regulator [Verrucosispora sp. WMMA2121]|uniref:MarR family winged helix-turn-helix transcriptional regulator n=1 Tax=Verrucosispora sp. WMMA2121 TaxID=3015164 RepID=UPI0022B67D83|nr:MarR family winged helix-turn-helix transcriptional regulator [Verrucosispora sp. WMMA2121]MCZ7421159.1 MarR family winged helix-turn-helix transcriptional regulator [Verrucosispora sp. WMMA2121]
MTSTPANTTTDTAATAQPAPSVAKVLAALHRLGEATAAAIATEAGLGYSTTTPKLRALETAGLAEPTRSDTGRSLWRLTDTGRAHTEQGDHGQPAPEPATRDTDTPGTAAEHGPRGDDTQDSEEAAGQDHDQQPAAEVPTDGQPDAIQESPSPAPGGVEAAPDEAAEAEDTETEHGDDSDRSTAEPEVPVTTGDTDPVTGATPAADEADARPATPDSAPAGTATDSTTGEPAVEAPAPPATEVVGEAAQAPARRASGTLRGAILDILKANPGQQYKVSELCKLVDRANEGTGAKKASAGAVHNAAVKLVGTGRAVLAAEKPATFALADPTA